MKHIKNIAKKVAGGMVYDNDINLLFCGWRGKNERVVALGPHDDDPLIGAGMLIYSLRQAGIEVYVAVMTDGSRGYCEIEGKNYIVELRKAETERAYAVLGVEKRRIKRFELPDSDIEQHIWKWDDTCSSEGGLVRRLIAYFREVGATRVLLPNGSDFHIDHRATFEAGLYCAVQAGEPIVPDLGESSRRDTILRYGVWSPFKGAPTHSVRMSEEALMKKVGASSEYKSQAQIGAVRRILESRGPFEFFQECPVAPYPSAEYESLFWGR